MGRHFFAYCDKNFIFNWPCPIFAPVGMGESGQNPEQFPLLYMQSHVYLSLHKSECLFRLIPSVCPAEDGERWCMTGIGRNYGFGQVSSCSLSLLH